MCTSNGKGCEAKFWLDPVRLAGSHGFASAELRRMERLVEERRTELARSWHEYFGD